MDLTLEASHTLIAGQSGMGKSTIAERLVWAGAYDIVYVLDHQFEFSDRFDRHPNDLERVKGWSDEKGQFCIVQPDCEKEEPIVSLEKFCEAVLNNQKASGEKAVMLIDELGSVVEGQAAPTSFLNCLRLGRRHNLETITIAQGLNEFPAKVRQQLTTVFFLGHGSKTAAGYAEDYGITAEELMTLPKLNFIRKTKLGIPERGQIEF